MIAEIAYMLEDLVIWYPEIGVPVSLVLGFILTPIMLTIIRIALKLLGVYVIVGERTALVYTLFGKVIGTVDEPGIKFLWKELGFKAILVPIFGKRYKVDMRLDQQYLRSQPVNSEEGAPMGVGLWYEMYINDPVAYIFRNTDPRGSLAANVGNSVVRCLSNLPLEQMMSNRHGMSRTVRNEVSEKSQEWGYKLGSCYIRKVHFRDTAMMQQIQHKVVNRLRQVTSAILQEGANQVKLITSRADREAAIDFSRAAAIKPQIIGKALQEISVDVDVCQAMFEILEINRIIEASTPIYQLPDSVNIMLPTGPGVVQ